MSIQDWLDRLRTGAQRARRAHRSARDLHDAYSLYTAANREWLSAFRHLTIEMAPHLAAATRLRFALQLAYLDRRDVRFLHLVSTAPERLMATASLAVFVGSVDQCWTGKDDTALNRLRPDYLELCAMITAVKAAAEKGVEGFSEHLDAVSKTERCLALLNAFRHEAERIEREMWSLSIAGSRH
jgi:hypothetical protein